MKGAKIGLEVHIQLNTNSKMFCSCATQAKRPNSATCEICLGMPGSKPVVNRKVVEYGIKLALSLSCNIKKNMLFSRKTYFYPDLPKNYQITQYENPLGTGGYIKVNNKKIRISRIHLEEDPASLKHPEGIKYSKYVLIDYNRSGVPLVEIVTEPSISSAKEARKFLEELLSILSYLNIFDPTKNIIKVDTNISVPKHPRVEIKNIGSIRDVEKAINFELIRQETNVLQGIKSSEETRAWTGSDTILLRRKETEEDYGYIFDPDLPIANITQKQISQVRKIMPELPRQRLERFKKQYKIYNEEIIQPIILEKELADDFEKITKKIDARFSAIWLSKYLKKVLNYNNIKYKDSKILYKELIILLRMIRDKDISSRAGELLLREIINKPENPRNLARRKNMLRLTRRELSEVIDKVIKFNPNAVRDYKYGKDKAFKYLVGQVMRRTSGRADAKRILNLLRHKVA